MNRTDSKEWVPDGNLAWSGGMDENTPPHLIQRDQVAFAVNATMRGVRAKPRPGYRKRLLTYATDVEGPFKTGRFQHAAFWDGTGVAQLLTSIGGRQFRISLDQWHVDEITPADGGNLSTIEKAWSVQAENYWILQDNHDGAIIYNGAYSRRADPAKKEIPVGNVMAYTMGRLIVSLPDRVSFRVGDIVFGSSGTPSLGYRDAMLRFTENDYLNEGGDFVARVFGALSKYGKITSMLPLAMLDQQLGQGPLLVSQPNMIFTVQLPFDRTTWKDLANALETANPIMGSVSQESTMNINGDVWYRRLDGVGSFMIARRDFGTWSNTPMSNEIGPTLDQDTQFLLGHASGVLFNNRMLMTVSPTRNQDHGTYHRGLISLDFDLVSSLRQKLSPAWEGIWTGLHILQIVGGLVRDEERCFVFCLNSNSEIELWEIVSDLRHDDNNGTITRIPWSLDLPSYNCGSSDQFKRLVGGRFVIENLAGELDITVKYRSDQNPCWQPWDTKHLCGLNEDCLAPECAGPHTYRDQVRNPIPLHAPKDDFDNINKRKWCTGYEFQPRLEMSGYGEIKQFRIFAKHEPERIEAERTQI